MGDQNHVLTRAGRRREHHCLQPVHVPAAVLHFDGTLDYFIQATFNYPTLGDTFKYAAYDGLQRLQRRLGKMAERPRTT